MNIVLFRIIDQKPLIRFHDDIRNIPGDVSEHSNTFLHRKQRRLRRIIKHGDMQDIKHFRCPADDIDMTIGDRIKTARINGCSHSGYAFRHGQTAALRINTCFWLRYPLTLLISIPSPLTKSKSVSRAASTIISVFCVTYGARESSRSTGSSSPAS